MRQAATARTLRQPASAPIYDATSIPAPTEGWDASSALADMKPKRAVILDNFFPQPGYIEFRKGYAPYSRLQILAVDTGPVESLMAYHGVIDSDDRLFAASDGAVFDATAGQDYAIISAVTGLGNSRLQHANFSTTGANYLYFVNGEDAPRAWDGSAWVTPAITGEDETSFINIAVHKNRLWFVEKNSLVAAYLPVDSFQGAAAAFPLQGIFSRGGFLVAIGTWTLDAGEGMDDHAVFVTSEGQVAVYAGTNPASATTWSLVGVFNIGPPIGYRCLTKVGGDVAIISIDGVLPLSQALMTDRSAAEKISLTRRIARAMNDAAQSYKENFGWQIIGYPKGTRAILNVPVSENSEQHQYVMNTIHGAWCRFTGWNANCFEVFQDRLFFGANNGRVCEADTGGSDGDEIIVGQVKTAFSDGGQRGVLKHFTMIRPLITTDGTVAPSILINVDFLDETPPTLPSDFETPGAQWDEVEWDAFTWPLESFILNEWQDAPAIGQWAAVNMKVSGRFSDLNTLWDEASWDVELWDSGLWGPGLPAVNLKVNAWDVLMEMGGVF